VILIDTSAPWATDELFRDVASAAPMSLRVAAIPEMEVWRAVRTSSLAHQVVSARSDVGIVTDVCERSLSVSSVLSNPKLLDVISETRGLSAPPELWHRLSEVLANPSSGAQEVAAAVATDPAITAQVMRMANSAFFGLSRKVERLEDAVSLLGLTLIRALVLEAEVSMSFAPTVPGFQRRLVQHHATGVANIARLVAGRSSAADAFLAGFLIDIGLILLASSKTAKITELVTRSKSESLSIHTIEREVLGFTHGELGACLLGLWGLPMTVVEAVALHHETPDFKGLMSVREIVFIARDAANRSEFRDPYDMASHLITDPNILADVTVGPIIDKAHLVASESA
jgi:HD-like signal output (HDOD) protein